VLAQPIAAATPLDRAEAFDRLLDRGLDAHYRLASVILGDGSEAEDAVHDAAVAAWQRFDRLRDAASFDAWFGRILVNGCRDRLRARRRRPVITALPVFGDLDHGLIVADGAGPVGDRDAIAKAFASLEPDQAIVVALRYYADLTVPEIARRVGIPEGTVKSRLHHALLRLRAAMSSNQEDRP
jgi:RNA polymerase sigma-70 factor (ECF subfamily)